MLKKKDYVKFETLGDYGFDDDIIKGLVKYEIFPTAAIEVDKNGNEVIYIKKDDIALLLNRVLKNTVQIYEQLEKVEQVCGDAADNFKNSIKTVTLDDLTEYKEEI